MSREELRRLIDDDAYAASFQTMGQYRSALLKAVDSAQDVARAPEGWNSIPNTPAVEVMEWYGEQFSEPVLLHDGELILPFVARWSFVEDGWVGANFAEGSSPLDYEHLNAKPMQWLPLNAAAPAAPAVSPEGCTPADAQMLRAANHQLAAENDHLRRRLLPFAQLASSPLSWAMIEYCIDGDPEKQTLQAPQMQRAFNRAADALRENVPSHEPADYEALDLPDWIKNAKPPAPAQAEQQGDGGAIGVNLTDWPREGHECDYGLRGDGECKECTALAELERVRARIEKAVVDHCTGEDLWISTVLAARAILAASAAEGVSNG